VIRQLTKWIEYSRKVLLTRLDFHSKCVLCKLFFYLNEKHFFPPIISNDMTFGILKPIQVKVSYYTRAPTRLLVIWAHLKLRVSEAWNGKSKEDNLTAYQIIILFNSNHSFFTIIFCTLFGGKYTNTSNQYISQNPYCKPKWFRGMLPRHSNLMGWKSKDVFLPQY